jgi:hypothetical protein
MACRVLSRIGSSPSARVARTRRRRRRRRLGRPQPCRTEAEPWPQGSLPYCAQTPGVGHTPPCSPLGTAPWKSDKPGTNTRFVRKIELAKVPKGSWLLRGWRLWSLRRWRVEGGDGHCDSILSAPCASGPRGLHGTAPQGLRARRRETDLPCLYSLSRDGVGHTRAGIRHPVRCPAPLPSSPPRAGRPLHGFDLLGRCLPAHALKSLALCTGEIGGA